MAARKRSCSQVGVSRRPSGASRARPRRCRGCGSLDEDRRELGKTGRRRHEEEPRGSPRRADASTASSSYCGSNSASMPGARVRCFCEDSREVGGCRWNLPCFPPVAWCFRGTKSQRARRYRLAGRANRPSYSDRSRLLSFDPSPHERPCVEHYEEPERAAPRRPGKG